MALKPCHECGKEVSTEAGQCPNCGAKVKRSTGVFGWIGAIVVGLVIFNIVTSANRSGPSAYDLERQAHSAAVTALKIEKYSWKKGGFDNIMIADFTLHNTGSTAVKDIEVTCESYGPSGTKIDSNVRKLYEIVPAGKSKRVREFNMGFQHSQASRAGCQITDLVVN